MNHESRQAFLRALEEAKDFLEFSAEKADFPDNEYYLAVRNFLEQTMREINAKL